MTVYIVLTSGGYEGERDTEIKGVYADPCKAKEHFDKLVANVKSEIGSFVEDEEYVGPEEEYEDKYVLEDGWEMEESDTMFCACESDRCSRNYQEIWIDPREVE